MVEFEKLETRMGALGDRIADARHRLTLHSNQHQEHSATLDELTERYLKLQTQLQNEELSLESHGVHVDSFERTLLGWINGLTLGH